MRRYRADNVGSFLRPPELLAARRSGTDAESLRRPEDREIARVLAKRSELGFDDTPYLLAGSPGPLMRDVVEIVAADMRSLASEGIAPNWRDFLR